MDLVLQILTMLFYVSDGKLVSYVDGNENLHGGIKGDLWPVTENYEGQNHVGEAETVPQIAIKEVIEAESLYKLLPKK